MTIAAAISQKVKEMIICVNAGLAIPDELLMDTTRCQPKLIDVPVS